MARIRMESLEIDDLDPETMALLDLQGALTLKAGMSEWLCGHCEETLLHMASERPNEGIVFRCPHCHGLSRYRKIQ